MMNFGNCRQVVSEIVVYVFLLYIMNFGNCRQAEHSTIVCFLFQSTYSRADRRKKLTISWDNSILPSYCALKASKYVSVCWRVEISCGLLPTCFSSNVVLNYNTVKKCEISNTFLTQMTYII